MELIPCSVARSIPLRCAHRDHDQIRILQAADAADTGRRPADVRRSEAADERRQEGHVSRSSHAEVLLNMQRRLDDAYRRSVWMHPLPNYHDGTYVQEWQYDHTYGQACTMPFYTHFMNVIMAQ